MSVNLAMLLKLSETSPWICDRSNFCMTPRGSKQSVWRQLWVLPLPQDVNHLYRVVREQCSCIKLSVSCNYHFPLVNRKTGAYSTNGCVVIVVSMYIIVWSMLTLYDDVLIAHIEACFSCKETYSWSVWIPSPVESWFLDLWSQMTI